MSGSREHKRRRPLVADYKRRLAAWEKREPPKWRFIARRKWKTRNLRGRGKYAIYYLRR